MKKVGPKRVEEYIRYYFQQVKHPLQLAMDLSEVANLSDMDIMLELSKAKAYMNNSGKNYRNHSRYLTNWINRAAGNFDRDEKAKEKFFNEKTQE